MVEGKDFDDNETAIRLLGDELERSKGLIDGLVERVRQLESQLPDEMKSCTILFRQCDKGHGRLTAKNWVDSGCGTCALRAAERRAVKASKEAANLCDTLAEGRFADDSAAFDAATTCAHVIRAAGLVGLCEDRPPVGVCAGCDASVCPDITVRTTRP